VGVVYKEGRRVFKGRWDHPRMKATNERIIFYKVYCWQKMNFLLEETLISSRNYDDEEDSKGVRIAWDRTGYGDPVRLDEEQLRVHLFLNVNVFINKKKRIMEFSDFEILVKPLCIQRILCAQG
jgi:hypothetical protein